MDDWVSTRGLAILGPERLRQLTRRSNARGLMQLASHLGALLATGTALVALWHTWAAIPAFLLHGYLLACLYAMQHEANHRTAFRSRWLNDTVTVFTGFVLIYPARWERWFHFAHHRHTQDPDKDPELLVRGPYTLGRYLLALSAATYLYRRFRMVVDLAAGRVPVYAYWLTEEQRRVVVAEARWHVLGYAAIAGVSIATGSWAVLAYWLLPMWVAKPLHLLQSLGRHVGLTYEPDTLRNTRTLDVPAPVRWALWNMPYHTVHHTFPSIPFHALPVAHREVQAKLSQPLPSGGYFQTQRDILRALSQRGDRLGVAL
jgi:fatty acid desaturase